MNYGNYDPRRAELEAEIDRNMAKANRWTVVMWTALTLLFLWQMIAIWRSFAAIDATPTPTEQLGDCQ